jgi:hypothetical protein
MLVGGLEVRGRVDSVTLEGEEDVGLVELGWDGKIHDCSLSEE